ncbi:MAG: bifunctional 5,10-methylenetetrahydrofolate dehydrogenase/5,10-methenyltetrahydrofolate cyclohydrolase [Pseudomonadota bacterium]|nr:bifunctional 5,10-methylenetetrahydrofolate dehydrogenase/5,10-methenyltetrahydrofolate cyclohydrolase [Pseudomonadota bacterium]
MAQTLDGKSLATQIETSLRTEIADLTNAGKPPPSLAVIQVGDLYASKVYVRRKHQACQRVGINSQDICLPTTTSEQQLLAKISELNTDTSVDAILMQLPLPQHINTATVLGAIAMSKDVDGLSPQNQGLLLSGKQGSAKVLPYPSEALLKPKLLIPCTPLGIMQLLNHYRCRLRGKVAMVVGRSALVGLPISQLLLQADATLIHTHSHSVEPKLLAKTADVLVVAVGVPHLVRQDWLKPDAVVIDVGINRQQGKLVGDVHPDVAEVASYITPVPGGVGPMTIAALLQNTVLAAQARHRVG